MTALRQTCGDYIVVDGKRVQCAAPADFVCDPEPDRPYRRFPLCAPHKDEYKDVRPMRDDERPPVEEEVTA